MEGWAAGADDYPGKGGGLKPQGADGELVLTGGHVAEGEGAPVVAGAAADDLAGGVEQPHGSERHGLARGGVEDRGGELPGTGDGGRAGRGAGGGLLAADAEGEEQEQQEGDGAGPGKGARPGRRIRHAERIGRLERWEGVPLGW